MFSKTFTWAWNTFSLAHSKFHTPTPTYSVVRTFSLWFFFLCANNSNTDYAPIKSVMRFKLLLLSLLSLSPTKKISPPSSFFISLWVGISLTFSDLYLWEGLDAQQKQHGLFSLLVRRGSGELVRKRAILCPLLFYRVVLCTSKASEEVSVYSFWATKKFY